MTPFETETLKMFKERFPLPWDYNTKRKDIEEYFLTQIRLARADERKQAYEELRDVIENGTHTPINAERYLRMVKDAKDPFDDGYNLGREEAYEHVLVILTKPTWVD
jgi:hypothetical protein